MMRKLFTALALTFLTVAPVMAQGTISGTVTDADTMAPIEHAIIIARDTAPSTGGSPWGGGWWSNITITGTDGTYSLDLDAGNYDVTCRKWGYVAQTANADVTDGATTTADFALGTPTFGTIAGTVTDADTMLPIENARVTVRSTTNNGWGGWRWGRTDAAGAYSIDNVRTGDHEVTVRKHGYETSAANAVTVTDGMTSTVDVALSAPATGTLVVQVNDNMNVGVDGAFVMGRRNGSGFGWFGWASGGLVFGMTDAAGSVQFDDVRTGDWMLWAGVQGSGRASATGTVTDGMTTNVTITLP